MHLDPTELEATPAAYFHQFTGKHDLIYHHASLFLVHPFRRSPHFSEPSGITDFSGFEQRHYISRRLCNSPECHEIRKWIAPAFSPTPAVQISRLGRTLNVHLLYPHKMTIHSKPTR
ncbi:hypothetical protein RRG08_018800 [Elysia crispata]|uniref:Uncharacterized protein n=1 Tax=Elysia crispata TaxID=231223 RepID=A0AAE1DMF6_9GAST|nr:hypothetical protein RRG08_018800 [Elysia crispata]